MTVDRRDVELVEKYLAGELAAAERAELRQRVRDDSELHAYFSDAIEDEYLMRSLRGAQPRVDADAAEQPASPLAAATRQRTRVSRRPRSTSRPWTVIAYCALGVLAVIAIVAVMFQQRRSASLPYVISASSPAIVRHLSGGEQPLQSGYRFEIGDRIDTASATGCAIAWRGEDTQMTLGSDSILECLDDANGKRLRLQQGILSARVAPQPHARPLVVLTPHAQATVVGTAFTLTISGDSTTLAVNHGTVRFAHADGADPLDVRSGEAARATDTAIATLATATSHDASATDDPAPSSSSLAGWTVTSGQWTCESGILIGTTAADSGRCHIDSRQRFTDLEMTCAMRGSCRYGEFQVHDYGWYIPVEIPDDGVWRTLHVIARGGKVTAQCDGIAIEPQPGLPDNTAGVISFHARDVTANKSFRLEIRDFTLRAP